MAWGTGHLLEDSLLLEVIKQKYTNLYGSEIVLLTDGEDTYMRSCLTEVENSGSIIHTIALGPNAAPELEQFSAMTGGLKFYATDTIDSNGLIDAFSGISSGSGNISEQSIQGQTLYNLKVCVQRASKTVRPHPIVPWSHSMYIPGYTENETADSMIILSWTASGDDLDHWQAASYEIRTSESPLELRDNFDKAILVNTSDLTPQHAGRGKLQVTMQSSSAQVTMMESQNRKRAPAWTEREVRDLIAVWGEESVLSELRSSFRNAKTFVKISQGMKDRGHNRDPKQCRVKLKELRQAYQKTREANGRSRSEPQTCRFYDELHAILGGSATTTPAMLFDSFNGDGGNTEAGFGDEEDDDDDDEVVDSSQQASGETGFPDSQELFLTLDLEPVPPEPTQGCHLDPAGGEGTSEASEA
ncbi:unnamed protein product [Eretmochelys imbricata]